MNLSRYNMFEDFFKTATRSRRKSARPEQAMGVRRSVIALALAVVIGYGVLALLLLAWPGSAFHHGVETLLGLAVNH